MIPYFNAKTKCYADGTTSTVVFDSPTFRSPEWSLAESLRMALYSFGSDCLGNRHFCKLYHQAFTIRKQLNIDPRIMNDDFILNTKRSLFPTRKKSLNTNTVPRSDSLKRAKDRIFDYVLSNDFNYFFTGTIDPKKMNSRDPKVLLHPIQDWLKNLVRRFNVEYVFVPEFHKDGEKIHFHGLIKCDDSILVDSKTKIYKGFNRAYKDFTAIRKGLSPENGRIVYNMPKWRFGFNTAIKLFGDVMNTAFYVTKYITKDCKKIFGKFFWHSRGLKKPEVRYENIDYDSVQSKEYFNEHIGHFKYIFRRGEENRRIEEEKNKALKKRSIFEETKQLFYDVVNDLVVNLNTGEVLDFETLIE